MIQDTQHLSPDFKRKLTLMSPHWVRQRRLKRVQSATRRVIVLTVVTQLLLRVIHPPASLISLTALLRAIEGAIYFLVVFDVVLMTTKKAFINRQLKKGRSPKQAENDWKLRQKAQRRRAQQSQSTSPQSGYNDLFSGLRGEVGRLEERVREDPGKWLPIQRNYLKNLRK